MAKLVLTNTRYFVGPADLTAQTNKVELDWTAEDKETTNFGSGGKKERIAGLEDLSISAEGQWQAGDPGYADDEFWNARRVLEAHTICPDTAVVGVEAYLTQAIRLDEHLFGQVGDVAMFQLKANGSYPLVQGNVLNSPGTTLGIGTTNGSNFTIAAGVPSGQKLYAAMHVLSMSGTGGPTLAMIVQSAATGDTGFASPTTRITFATAAGIGSQVLSGTPGPITDTLYRVQAVVTGTAPSFLAIVTLGVAP